MKEAFIETENYIKIMEGFARLESLPANSTRRLGLGYGSFGLGKTFALERVAVKKNAILLRAGQTWTKKVLAEKLCVELNLDVTGSSGHMIDRVCDDLRREYRIIIIDEIDTLLRGDKIEVFELLRDILDTTSSILFFVGMEEANAKFKRYKHYYSRIGEFVEFKNIGREDIKKFCRNCDVRIEDDVIEYFAKKYPNLRQIKMMLFRIEKRCDELHDDWESVSMERFHELKVEG